MVSVPFTTADTRSQMFGLKVIETEYTTSKLIIRKLDNTFGNRFIAIGTEAVLPVRSRPKEGENTAVVKVQPNCPRKETKIKAIKNVPYEKVLKIARADKGKVSNGEIHRTNSGGRPAENILGKC